jgi:hypothetical protein
MIKEIQKTYASGYRALIMRDQNVIELDDERKTAMVSHLLVVLCAQENAQPVLNTGSLYN